MTDHVQLYERRVGELEQLVAAHVGSGSLDEGNAATFDGIIDAWLQDELVRVEQLLDDEANSGGLVARRRAERRAALNEGRETILNRVASSWDERRTRRAARREARTALADARRERRQLHVDAARRRLDVATAELAAARADLLGEPAHVAPASLQTPSAATATATEGRAA